MSETFVDFEGKRFYEPLKCLCCGKDVSVEQFCYGRTCAYCDLGSCQKLKNPELMGKVPMIEIDYEKGHGRKDIFEDAENVPISEGERNG